MEEKLSVMCVVAHPADMVTECGGTLALHAARGDEVTAVILTHGGRVHPVIYVEESRKDEGDQKQDIAEAQRNLVLDIKHAEIEAAAKE